MLEKQQPYKYKVYEVIKTGILTGEYKSGTVLNERKLSAELGISRTPVREALLMLEQDGWLQAETYKGTVVRKFDEKYFHEILEIRRTLEILAIRNAIPRITDKDISELEKIQQEQTEVLKEYEDNTFILIDRKFHKYIYQLSGNDELVHLLANYYDIFRFLGKRAVTGSKERQLTTLIEHQSILDALKRRDTDAAVEAMITHMQQTERNVIIQLDAIEKASTGTE